MVDVPLVIVKKGEFFFGEVVRFQGHGEDVFGWNARFDGGRFGLMNGGEEIEFVLLLLFAAVNERVKSAMKEMVLNVRFALRVLDADFLDILLAQHVSIPSVE